MAWDVHTHYIGANWEIYGVTALLGADVFLQLAHGLGKIPILCMFTSMDSGAAASAFWIDNATDTTVDINRAAGAPGAHIHVHLANLGHPH